MAKQVALGQPKAALLQLDAQTGVHNLKFGGKPALIWSRVEDTRSTVSVTCL
jgi:hypothetical protein